MKNLNDDWYALGSNYYRRLKLFSLSLSDSINFDDFFIAIRRTYGQIAFLQRPTSSTKPFLRITTSSGKMIAENLWKDAPPVAIGWTTEDELAVVQRSGYVTLLTMNATFKRRLSLGKEAETAQIVKAKFFTYEDHTAVAYLTGNSRIFIATSLERQRILAIADIPHLARPSFLWNVVSSHNSNPGLNSDAFKGPWIMLVFSRHIFRLGVGSTHKVELPSSYFSSNFSAVIKMAVSGDEQSVALFLDTDVLWVGSLDFSEVKFELPLRGRVSAVGSEEKTSVSGCRPLALKWLDNSTIAVQWTNFIVLVDFEKNVYEFFYPTSIHTEVEVDGLRILTPSSHELLQRVPSPLENLGRIGASCPAVLLLSAYKHWEERSGGAHEYLRSIQSGVRMLEAVSQCLDAACHSALAAKSTAKALLSAARFGRGFLSVVLTSPDKAHGLDASKVNELSQRTVEICNTLRLLNNLAVPWISIAITWFQYESIGPLALLDRLLSCGHYPIAVELVRLHQRHPSLLFPEESAKIRTLGMTRILSHWVTRLPSGADQGPELHLLLRRLTDVLTKLAGSPSNQRWSANSGSGGGGGLVVPSLSFTDVATRAAEYGHRNLAEKLLELEPRPSLEIPLLLRLNKHGLALTRAVESGDTDLLLQVLMALQDTAKLDAASLGLLLRQHPTALAFYREHLEQRALTGCEPAPRSRTSSQLTFQALAALQKEDDQSVNIKREVVAAFASRDMATRSSALQNAKDSYQQIKHEFLAQACEEATKLLNFHKKLEQQRVSAPAFRLQERTAGVGVGPHTILPDPALVAASPLSQHWQGDSTNLTYVRLLVGRHERLADQMRREFRIPEKRVAYLRLIGLALTKDGWPEIEKMSLAKKPPVPLETIVEVYIHAGRGQESLNLVARLPIESRIRYLTLLGNTKEAISLARQDRTGSLLYLIQRHLSKTDRAAHDEVAALRARLGQTGASASEPPCTTSPVM
ncbi:Vacuolar protein sorting-associated protein 16 [Sparganum proliferum]